MEKRIWHKAYAKAVPPINFPDTTALIMMGRRINYKELDELVNRFATALADLGIQKGDKVALLLPNIPQVVIAAYAVFRLGAVVVIGAGNGECNRSLSLSFR